MAGTFLGVGGLTLIQMGVYLPVAHKSNRRLNTLLCALDQRLLKCVLQIFQRFITSKVYN